MHQQTSLISIGLVSECGKIFYAEFTDYDQTQVDKWIKENVVDNLILNNSNTDDIKAEEVKIKGTKEYIRQALTQWFSLFDKVEMWGDCLSYDWVLFCQIWGNAFNIPKNIYYIPFDISTLFKVKGIDPDISRELFSDLKSENIKHNALWDAFVISECYRKLIS